MTQTEHEKEKEGFLFTYSAKEQQEVKAIREKYQPREENKMEKLRRLDAGVTEKATALSLAVGIQGTLVMGMGMSLTMTELGSAVGLFGTWCMVLGIFVGLIGIVFACLAYPVYQHTLKKERSRIAPEILRLTEELMK